jgi:hypothetical protein
MPSAAPAELSDPRGGTSTMAARIRRGMTWTMSVSSDHIDGL